MKKHILFVHGGGAGAYAEDAKLVAGLRDRLGAAPEVLYPQMPHEDSPVYAAWHDEIDRALAPLAGDTILVGHSLGGSVVLKYLAEQQTPPPIAGVFVIAAPFWGGDADWQADDYTLREDFAAMLSAIPHIFYHSRDDEVVPFAHLGLYAANLPQATMRAFDTGGHQCTSNLAVVAADIQQSC